MRLLIMGGKGMAGHMITSYFKKKTEHEVFFSSREDGFKLDATELEKVREAILQIRPDVIINCVGLLNDKAAEHLISAIKVNSLLPHVLAEAVSQYGGKVIHISTDCVFFGDKGSYSEQDPTDGTSVYAKTKALGELHEAPHLTFRTSIIGPEIKENGIGLLQWFMKQKGEIKGFTKVYWNGVTTLELAKAIEAAIEQDLTGLYHLTAPESTSKYDLLRLFQQSFHKKDVLILPDDNNVIDRTLKNTRKDFHYEAPPYPQMMLELAKWMEAND